MSFVDTIARSQAAQAISKYGKTVVYTAITAGVYDPDTHSVTDVETATSRKVVIEVGSGAVFDVKTGTVIETGDLKITYSAKDYPKSEIGDTYLVDGVLYRVLKCDPIYSGEQIAIWICGLKK